MAQQIAKNKGPQNLERSQQGSRTDVWPAYSPFGMMRRFADDMDRMFEGFGLPSMRRFSPSGWGSESRFSPDLEILERDGKLLVRADLPGLSKDDVHVDVSDHSITIEGERKSEHETNEEGVYTCERSYGHFHREIPLPEGVKTDTAKANFKNGTLEITLDAPEAAKNRRRIQIEEEQGDTKVQSKKGETAA
jgi:HSP20 family protein